jgi:hypothetical protein
MKNREKKLDPYDHRFFKKLNFRWKNLENPGKSRKIPEKYPFFGKSNSILKNNHFSTLIHFLQKSIFFLNFPDFPILENKKTDILGGIFTFYNNKKPSKGSIYGKI